MQLAPRADGGGCADAMGIPTALSTIAKFHVNWPTPPWFQTDDTGGSGSHSDSGAEYWNYAVFLFCFIGLTLPICFFDFQKSAWLQYGTCAVRNSSFFIMVGIMVCVVWPGCSCTPHSPCHCLMQRANLTHSVPHSLSHPWTHRWLGTGCSPGRGLSRHPTG
jgi:hypothetical protein|eukprot:COSAG01_NODE_28445_length_660_cov_42.960784_2_plen_162_part_00